MNILWDGEIQLSFPLGGVSRYCAELLRGLTEEPDMKVLVACPAGAPGFPVSSQRIRQISMCRWKTLNRHRIRAFKPGLFHTSYYSGPPAPGLPSVVTVYDFIDARFPALQPNGHGFPVRQREAIESAAGAVAISETTRQDILRFTTLPLERTVVAYPSLAESFNAPLCSEEERDSFREAQTCGKPYWLWVGPPRFGYKNFAVFLDAFTRVARETDTHLVIVCGQQQQLDPHEQRVALQHRLADRIHLLPRVDDSFLRRLYSSAQALVQSSCWEGFGIPLVEALSCGTGLVVSDIPAFREAAGNMARFVEPLSVDAWSRALLDALEEKPDALLRRTRRAQVENRYTLKACATTVRSLYDRIAGS